MKHTRLSFVFMVAIFAPPILFAGCQSTQTNRQPVTSIYYTCPMHHQVHKDMPGNCPICGMKLIKVTSPGKTDTMPLDSALSYLTEPVTQTVIGSFKVIESTITNPEDTITADGYVGFDERDINTVSTRVTGRIEKLYVRYENQRIYKREPLMVIYSPELLSVQRNLLQVMQDNDQTLIRSLKEQLINLGMQAPEIQKVMQSRKPLSRITIYSPYSGISRQIINKGADAMNNMVASNSVVALQTKMGMNEKNLSAPRMATESSANPPEALNIREGMYVNRGQTVFSIQNTDRIWIILNVFTRNVWRIHPGDAVSLSTDADPAAVLKGRVDFIPPYRARGEKTTQIRIYLPTGQARPDHLPRDWKINTLVHGQVVIGGQNKGVYVPLSAVNRLGMQSVVWVQDKQHANVFHTRNIKTGIETEDSIQVIAGIQPGEKIAENAAYMVGSDSFIQ